MKYVMYEIKTEMIVGRTMKFNEEKRLMRIQ